MDTVFHTDTEDSVTNSWFHPCLKEAKLTDYVWHCNRHTFCSWLAMNGASIKGIQVAAGHKTIQMAAKYSHLSPAHNQGVVDRISSAVRRPQKLLRPTATKLNNDFHKRISFDS
jgi:site-specific recombinase XerD